MSKIVLLFENTNKFTKGREDDEGKLQLSPVDFFSSNNNKMLQFVNHSNPAGLYLDVHKVYVYV